MAFQDFMSQVRKRGIAKRSHYIVEMTPPSFLQTTSDTLQIIPLFCEQAMFPEFVLQTQMIQDGGIHREVVVDKMYGSFQLTFACDQQMTIKHFFDTWAQASVYNKGGLFLYPDNYTIDNLAVYQIDAKLQEVYVVVLHKVYPKIVHSIFMAAADRSYSSFQVDFAFESWTSLKFEVDMSGPPPAAITGVFDPNVQQRKPKFMMDIASILDFAKMGKNGIKSSLMTRGTMAIQELLSKSNLLSKLPQVGDLKSGGILGGNVIGGGLEGGIGGLVNKGGTLVNNVSQGVTNTINGVVAQGTTSVTSAVDSIPTGLISS
jgi:hypothetical protein